MVPTALGCLFRDIQGWSLLGGHAAGSGVALERLDKGGMRGSSRGNPSTVGSLIPGVHPVKDMGPLRANTARLLSRQDEKMTHLVHGQARIGLGKDRPRRRQSPYSGGYGVARLVQRRKRGVF